MKIRFTLNQESVRLEAPPGARAIDLLRDRMGLTGVKESCGSGECGSCTILVDGEGRLSCLTLAAQLEGRRVVTIEGVSLKGELHPLQEAFVEHGAVQCGYCTPGMVLTSLDLLKRNEKPTRGEIREAIGGNLCRCTGYQKIVDAVEAFSRKDKGEGVP
jgi:aerobic carbon-monoxide dehydrogenase small subunit